jgi:hypothetical protein
MILDRVDEAIFGLRRCGDYQPRHNPMEVFDLKKLQVQPLGI